MRTALLLIGLAILAALGGCSSSGGFSLSPTEQEMVTRHNDARAVAGVGALTVSSVLSGIAQDHANYMASVLTVKHEDGHGDTVADRAVDAGYIYIAIGENIGQNTSPSGQFDGWMNSAGHKANIENGIFTEIGVGMTQVLTQQYWCVVFGDR